MFGDNRLQLLENSHVLLTRDRSFLSFFWRRISFLELIPRDFLRYGKIYWTSSKGISRGRKGGRSWLNTTIYNESIRAVGRRVLHVFERGTCKTICIRSRNAETMKWKEVREIGGITGRVTINNDGSCARGWCNGIVPMLGLGSGYLARGVIASVRGSYELGRLIGRWLDLSCARLTGWACVGARFILPEKSYNFSRFHFPSILSIEAD